TPVTRSNNSDGLLGHRYGYLSAAAIQDPTVVACDEDLDAEPDCGAMLEQWPDADAAAARSGVLLGLYRDGPLTGSEHHYLRGGLLLRVWGGLSESRVAEYAAAFAERTEK
ncbi:hypothetical protein, partial [Nocardioides stalactiti]|uniref:hypothetical protein n=1 Tax=Nocardioides stalactiti TaxID=2755356 RepID=UPI001C7E4C49